MSQEQTLLLFTIGPVQSFIAASRKLEDVWSGSYLLTLLAKRAIEQLKSYAGQAQVEMIFPSDSSVQLESIGEYPVASLPNRFLCVVHASPDQVSTWAKQTETMVRANIEEMVNYSIQDVFMGGKVILSPEDLHPFEHLQQLAQTQVKSQIELFWAVEPIVGNRLGTTRTELEKKLNAIKRHRTLPNLEQRGLICTVCGQHEALHIRPHRDGAPKRELRRELTDTWNLRVESYKTNGRIQDREYLCGVCLMKRTGRGYVSQVPKYPSVDDIGKGDGYYGILLMDGDNMGQWLTGHDNLRPQSESTPEVVPHLQKISDRLATFSQKTVPQIVQEHQGVLLYAGGDDVLAMAPVDQIVKIAQKLRASFASETTGLHPLATASAGIVLADHKAPLQKLLHHVRRLEQRAKGYQQGRKDAVAIAVFPRSGEVREFVLPWLVRTEGRHASPIETLSLLNELTTRLGTDLSSTFLYAFKEAFLPMFGGGVLVEHAPAPSSSPLSTEALTLEMYRLLNRAALSNRSTGDWYQLASHLIGLQVELHSMLEFIHFLEASRFINQIVKGREGVKKGHVDTTASNTR